MSHPQWLELTEQSIQLQGELDRDSVPSLWKFAQTWYPQALQVELSLKEVKRVDSAGMVMLIHLLEHAKKRNCHIMLFFVISETIKNPLFHKIYNRTNLIRIIPSRC